MSDVIIPSGYEQAYNFYLGDAGAVSESEARNNLMQQLNAGNINEEALGDIVKMAQLYAYRPLPEVMAEASSLMGQKSSVNQNFIGAVMLTQSLFWGTVVYKSEVEALRLSINGFERWLKAVNKRAPWAMASLYTIYAEKVANVTDQKLYMNKALNLYESVALKPKCRIDFYNALYEYLNIEKDPARIVQFFEKVDDSISKPLEHEFIALDEPIPLFVSRPFGQRRYSSYEIMQGLWIHLEDTKKRIAATAYLLMLLQRIGANEDTPSGVAYREIIFEKYMADGEADVQWIDMVYALVKAQWKGYEQDKLFLDAEYLFIRGHEDHAKKLLTDYYSKDFEADYTVRIRPFLGYVNKDSNNMLSRFNKLIDSVKTTIYKANK